MSKLERQYRKGREEYGGGVNISVAETGVARHASGEIQGEQQEFTPQGKLFFRESNANNLALKGFADYAARKVPGDKWEKIEEYQRLKSEGRGPGLGNVILDDGYFEYLEHKRNELNRREFEAYIVKSMDISTAARRQWWMNKFPVYFQKKVDYIRLQGLINMRRATIAAVGTDSESDLRFMYFDNMGAFDGVGSLEELYHRINDSPMRYINSNTNFYKDASDGRFKAGIDNNQVDMSIPSVVPAVPNYPQPPAPPIPQ